MRGPRLLVVEDDAFTRRLLKVIFTDEGWNVDVASSIADALPLLEPAPDCMILDLSLPDGDGIEVLQRVRSKNLHTRVAVTTGDDAPDVMDRVRELHPDAILLKPVEVEDLRHVLLFRCGARRT